MRTSHLRTAALVAVLSLAIIGGVVMYQETDTILPQPPAVGQAEQQLRDGFRRGRIRLVIVDRILEVRVNGEALLGYTGRAARLEDVDTNVVRGIARRAVDLYAPPQFGPPPGVDSVRIRLRHNYMFGPLTYRTAGRNFDFATSQLGR